MFAYCLNNPVNGVDVCGYITERISSHFSFTCELDGGGGISGCGGSGGSGYKDILDEVSQRIDKLIKYLTNTDEQVILDADFIAFYKGSVIVKAPIGNNAFSFGVIVMGNETSDVDDVRHEYGHYVHMSQVGLDTYFATAAIPSLIGFWSGVDYSDYYSQPWEYVADCLGGVSRDNGNYAYADWAGGVAIGYWIATLYIGGLFK